MSKFVTIVRTSVLAISAIVASAPAFAGTVENAPTIAVSYADLDLSNTAGQNRLHNRLASAARSVCESARTPGSLIQPAYSACVSNAMTHANTEFAALTSSSGAKVAMADRR